jgi:hypothetical protein
MTMSFLRSRSDPLAAVTSVLPDHYYPCPNIASVDRHIAELVRQLGTLSPPGESPHGDARHRQAIRDDIDRLLDRRLYLELVREGSAPVGPPPARPPDCAAPEEKAASGH